MMAEEVKLDEQQITREDAINALEKDRQKRELECVAEYNETIAPLIKELSKKHNCLIGPTIVIKTGQLIRATIDFTALE